MRSDIKLLNEEQLAILPLSYLMECVSPLCLEYVWLKLPKHFQSNVNLRKRLPCRIHYNISDTGTHFDGPPPPVYKCAMCLYNFN